MSTPRLPGKRVMELDPGTKMYHFSKSVDELIASGRFDPARSAYGVAMFFTQVPVGDTNCEVEITRPCLIADLDLIRTPDEAARSYIGLQLASRAIAMGLDGFRNKKMAGLTMLEDGSFAAEIIILHDALHKLVPRVFEADQ